MNITTKSIVSNSDMIKNYKSCRIKAEEYGKIIILKNNQPDAVLFSIAEYERISAYVEYIENLDEQALALELSKLPSTGYKKRDPVNSRIQSSDI